LTEQELCNQLIDFEVPWYFSFQRIIKQYPLKLAQTRDAYETAYMKRLSQSYLEGE
jgi:hypothetical protein